MATDSRLTFSKRLLEALPVPSSGRTYWYDLRQPGLALCVTSTGTRTFYLYRRARGRPIRYRIGRFPEISLEAARGQAAAKLAVIAAGGDPMEERRAVREEPTLADLWEQWLEVHARPHKKASSIREDERQFNKFLAGWKTRRLSAITKADVQALHSRIGRENGHYAANRLLALLRAMFNKADDIGFQGHNPTSGIKKFQEHERERFLEPHEVPRFFAALSQEPDDVRDYFMLAILTGARKSALMAMEWSEVSGDVWHIPPAKSKSNHAIDVPLVPEALAILRARRGSAGSSAYVFPGPGKTGHLVEVRRPWDRVRSKAGLPDLRIHDLRRTLGSWQAATGASLPVIGRMLGHGSGSKATGVYARLTLDPVRESAVRATQALLLAANGKEGSSDGL